MFNGPGSDWNQKKIKAIIEHYGHQFFVHKKVLDLGCGHGDIGGVLHRLGSDVTVVDARQDHLKMVGKKYAGVKIVKADLDGAWPFHGKAFDVTVDMGLLCHLKNFEEHLRNVCVSTTYLILETAVLDANNPNLSYVVSDNKTADGSFNGFSSQVTSDYIERVLRECGMSYKRIDSAKFNTGCYIYDWKSANNSHYSVNNRRLWFCINEQRNPDYLESLKTQVNTITIPSPSTVGIFSNTLTDSRIPVIHKPVLVTRSPSVPHIQRLNSVTTLTPPRAIRMGDGSMKVRLFYNYYEDPDPNRRREIDFCLQKNIDNPLFNIVIMGTEPSEHLTFEHVFQAVNKIVGPNDVTVISNSDIFFDDTIKLAYSIQPNKAYALSRWDYLRDNLSTFSNKADDQDAWIFRGKINNVNGNFAMGKPGSSGRLAHELQSVGYLVVNPSRSIRAYHVQQSGVKNHTETDKINGPYSSLEPISL